MTPCMRLLLSLFPLILTLALPFRSSFACISPSGRELDRCHETELDHQISMAIQAIHTALSEHAPPGKHLCTICKHITTRYRAGVKACRSCRDREFDFGEKVLKCLNALHLLLDTLDVSIEQSHAILSFSSTCVFFFFFLTVEMSAHVCWRSRNKALLATQCRVL